MGIKRNIWRCDYEQHESDQSSTPPNTAIINQLLPLSIIHVKAVQIKSFHR